MNILIVVAHLDDEVYGMGGTILKLSKNPNNVIKIVSVSEGMLWVNNTKRQRTFAEFCQVIGAYYVMLDYTDTTFDTVPQNEIQNKLQGIFNDFEPDIVFTHSVDLHLDHEIISKSMDVVCRPRVDSSIKKLYHFSIPGNTDWKSDFIPNTYIDISEHSKTKKEYIKKYKQYPKMDPLSYKKIKSRDEHYGAVVGVKRAEAFQLIFERE